MSTNLSNDEIGKRTHTHKNGWSTSGIKWEQTKRFIKYVKHVIYRNILVVQSSSFSCYIFLFLLCNELFLCVFLFFFIPIPFSCPYNFMIFCIFIDEIVVGIVPFTTTTQTSRPFFSSLFTPNLLSLLPGVSVPSSELVTHCRRGNNSL